MRRLAAAALVLAAMATTACDDTDDAGAGPADRADRQAPAKAAVTSSAGTVTGGSPRWESSEENCERWGEIVGDVINGVSGGGFENRPALESADSAGCHFTVLVDLWDLAINTSFINELTVESIDPDSPGFREDNHDVVRFDVPGAEVAYWAALRNPDGSLIVYRAGMYIDDTWVALTTGGNPGQDQLLTSDRAQEALTLLAREA